MKRIDDKIKRRKKARNNEENFTQKNPIKTKKFHFCNEAKLWMYFLTCWIKIQGLNAVC